MKSAPVKKLAKQNASDERRLDDNALQTKKNENAHFKEKHRVGIYE